MSRIERENLFLSKSKSIVSPFWGTSGSLRFHPEGEGDGDGDGDGSGDAGSGNAAEEAVIKEAANKAAKETDVFDKERQRGDQEAANALRARESAQAATQQLETVQAENETMKAEKADLEAKLQKSAGQGAPKLNVEDYDTPSDQNLVRAIKGLEEKLEASDRRTADLEKTKDELIANRQADREAVATNKTYNALLDDLDDEYGASHRNVAVAEFTALREDGKIKPGAVAGTRQMEKCYKNALKAAKDKGGKNKDSLNLDTGQGGGESPGLRRTEFKKGSLEDVVAEHKAAG